MYIRGTGGTVKISSGVLAERTEGNDYTLKVAIIGAGIAGLSCAHELERHGIYPTVYEKKSFIGDIESHITANVNIMNRPIRDWIEYSKEKFNIQLQPVNKLRKITHYSPGSKLVVKGNLGYLFKRNDESDSLLFQLYSQLTESRVLLSESGDYEKLRNEYDFVVIANGDANYTNELGCWQHRVSGWIKGAVVLGSFDPTEIIMWIDKSFTNKGYAYLTPFNEHKASISLYVPYINEQDIDHYWELFLYSENIRYTIIEEYKKLHHSGHVYPHQVDNILFAGISGGTVDSFLGFGQVDTLHQGIYAAQAIAAKGDYTASVKNMNKKLGHLWEFRKAFDRVGNKHYDKIFRIMGMSGMKQLLYKSPINPFKIGAQILKQNNLRK